MSSRKNGISEDEFVYLLLTDNGYYITEHASLLAAAAYIPKPNALLKCIMCLAQVLESIHSFRWSLVIS